MGRRGTPATPDHENTPQTTGAETNAAPVVDGTAITFNRNSLDDLRRAYAISAERQAKLDEEIRQRRAGR